MLQYFGHGFVIIFAPNEKPTKKTGEIFWTDSLRLYELGYRTKSQVARMIRLQYTHVECRSVN